MLTDDAMARRRPRQNALKADAPCGAFVIRRADILRADPSRATARRQV
jgi:hypothetical protein